MMSRLLAAPRSWSALLVHQRIPQLVDQSDQRAGDRRRVLHDPGRPGRPWRCGRCQGGRLACEMIFARAGLRVHVPSFHHSLAWPMPAGDHGAQQLILACGVDWQTPMTYVSDVRLRSPVWWRIAAVDGSCPVQGLDRRPRCGEESRCPILCCVAAARGGSTDPPTCW
jgi:hypothetical protein